MNKTVKKEIDDVIEQVSKNTFLPKESFAMSFGSSIAKKYKLDLKEVIDYIMQKLSGQ